MRHDVKHQVKEKYDTLEKSLRAHIENLSSENIQKIKKEFSSKLDDHDSRMNGLMGEIYRAVGQSWNSQNKYSLAFIWFLRSTEGFVMSQDDTMIRIMLGLTQESLAKVKNPSEISSGDLGEFQNLLKLITDPRFKMERELLETTMKIILEKKLPTISITESPKN